MSIRGCLLVHGLIFQCTASSAIKITSERLVALTAASKGDSCAAGERRNTADECEEKKTTCTLTERQHRPSSHSPFCCFNRFPFGCSFVFFSRCMREYITHLMHTCASLTHSAHNHKGNDSNNSSTVAYFTEHNWIGSCLQNEYQAKPFFLWLDLFFRHSKTFRSAFYIYK